MGKAHRIESFLVLAVFLVLLGCSAEPPPTSFRHESGISFDFPDGWSCLSTKEWRDRDMGEDNTLITIMDKYRDAGFSLISVELGGEARATINMLGQDPAAKAAMFVESIDAAGPGTYQEYRLLSKGGAGFADYPMAEIIFQGRNPGKTLKWYRVLALTSPGSDETLLMFVFTAPIGEEGLFEQDFDFIESSWKWRQ